MRTIKLDHKLTRVEVKEFEIENQVVFNFFNKLPDGERSDALLRAIYIGVLALLEDRFSSFLAKTSNDLGVELESLKMIFDMKKDVFYKSAIKGILAENDIVEFLTGYLRGRNLSDKVLLTGNSTGSLPRNKTGDIVCCINGKDDLKVAIECKFDKSIHLGDITSKEVFTKKTDTAWSQLMETEVNRSSQASIIVFDCALVDSSILKMYDNVGFIPNIGFIAIIDSQKGDYSNLAIAYMLARDITLNVKSISFDEQILCLIVSRVIKNIDDILTIKNLVEANIENSKSILKQLEKGMLGIEFSKEYLLKFLNDGNLSKEDLLAFYQGEDIKDKYRLIEKSINNFFA